MYHKTQLKTMAVQGSQGYEYLDHTADAKFRAYGKTMEEAFENAALAMLNVMIDTRKVSDEVIKDVEVTSPDLDGLLVDWLSELLFIFEVDFLVFSRFDIESIKKHDGEYLLSARIFGEEVDPEVHKFDTHIKAVTYNGLEVEETPQGFALQVIVDT